MARREHITRRQAASFLGTALTISVAGCADSDDDADDETDLDANGIPDEDEEEASLVVFLEDEDGEAVPDGLSVEIIDREESLRYIVDDELEDGVAEPDVIETGSYTVVAGGEGYNSVEENITIDNGDEKEITLVLEASS